MALVRTVGITLLKDKLSTYVRLAESGETILVTLRGRVVAELVPPRAVVAPRDPRLTALVRRGLLHPATAPPDVEPPRKPVAPLAQLLAEIDADRSDR
jgi:antitoxin (DNA-binding transcriptional repressor) of toxin-antitoxin stability system